MYDVTTFDFVAQVNNNQWHTAPGASYAILTPPPKKKTSTPFSHPMAPSRTPLGTKLFTSIEWVIKKKLLADPLQDVAITSRICWL